MNRKSSNPNLINQTKYPLVEIAFAGNTSPASLRTRGIVDRTTVARRIPDGHCRKNLSRNQGKPKHETWRLKDHTLIFTVLNTNGCDAAKTEQTVDRKRSELLNDYKWRAGQRGPKRGKKNLKPKPLQHALACNTLKFRYTLARTNKPNATT